MNNIIKICANDALFCVPAEEDVFHQARILLDGAYLEPVGTSIPGLVMLVDKAGKIKGLPFNKRATALYPNRSDVILGDVVLVDVRNESFCALKNSGYVEKVLKLVV